MRVSPSSQAATPLGGNSAVATVRQYRNSRCLMTSACHGSTLLTWNLYICSTAVWSVWSLWLQRSASATSRPTSYWRLQHRFACTPKQMISTSIVHCYVDCSPSISGKFSVEKSPISDLHLMFASGVIDPLGCVLAITLASEDPDSAIDAPQHLR